MNNVQETLQQLVERRLRELGARRGRGPLTLREAWLAVEDRVSYETVRRIGKGTHTKIGDDVIDALATMLDVSPSDVAAAAGRRPRLGRFELPRRADRLLEREREVVIEVVDAILEAGERGKAAVVPIRTSGAAAGEEMSEEMLAWRRHVVRLMRQMLETSGVTRRSAQGRDHWAQVEQMERELAEAERRARGVS